MSEIFVDQNCTVCSAYGKFINKKNKNVSVSNQLDLSNEDIARDEVVYVKNQEKFYASDAIIESVADLGAFYKIIKTFVLFSIFRAIHGVVVLIVFYYFGYKANVGFEVYILYLIVSILLSRQIFKRLKKRFNL